jgi:hypothetical protein
LCPLSGRSGLSEAIRRRVYEFTPYFSTKSAQRWTWSLAALETRFKPPAHLAVRLPASHMTVSQAGLTGSMTPWRQS